MPIKPYQPPLTNDPILSKAVQSSVESFQSLQQIPFLNGVMLENVSLDSDKNNVVKHTLGRNLVGCMVLLQSADARIWHDQTTNISRSTYIIIQTSANVVVTLWVF